MVKNTIQTVAMFGGSFDPPHLGHRIIVEKALIELDIDLLIIMPAYQNPLKKASIATPAQRMKMCKTVFEDLPKVTISDYEMQQEIRYTSNSVKYFKTMYDLKYLIIGADNLPSLHLWHDFKWLNSNINWVIASRENATIDENSVKILKHFIVLDIDKNISSSEIRDGTKQEMIDQKISSQIETIYKGIK